MRLLHVLGFAGGVGTHAGQTGVERVVEQLLDGLVGFEHSVAYPPDGALFSRYGQQADALFPLEASRRFDRSFVDALAHFILERDIEVVLSHGFVRNDFLTALACRRTRRRHVVRRPVPLFDEDLPWLRRVLYAIPDAWTLRHCTHVIACSEATRQRMIATQRLAAEKTSVIYNGVGIPHVDAARRKRVRESFGVDASTLVVGGMGQLIPRKRFVDLVDAVSRLRGNMPQIADRVVCVIVGAGPERETLMRRAHAQGVRLHLTGFLAEPWHTIAAMDVAVLPSSAEGMPLSLLESMALGVPTVATAVAGVPEVVVDGRTGFLVDPGDVPALADRIGRLCSDGELRARIGAAGAQHVQVHFSLAAVLNRFDRCLRDLVQRQAHS